MSLAVQPAPGPLPFTEPQPPYPASPPKAVLVAPDGGPAWADRLYRFSLDQYHRMAEADLFGPEDRVELIEGLVVRLKAEVGRPVKVIATGGLATLFERHSDVFDTLEPDLTIRGLAIMWGRLPT